MLRINNGLTDLNLAANDIREVGVRELASAIGMFNLCYKLCSLFSFCTLFQQYYALSWPAEHTDNQTH